jgi:(p)ppGpp synthase/HD superfamily hydrolase
LTDFASVIMSNIEQALEIALAAHRGQKDCNGKPAILHALRVMARLDHFAAPPDPQAQIVALLHDVVEDSECTLENLAQQGFSSEIVAAVDALTRRDNESYSSLVRRAKANPLATAVKRSDLADHLDPHNVHFQDSDREKHTQRIRRYVRATLYLKDRMTEQEYLDGASPDELQG